jgi:N-acetylglucosaminyldiphosphoundecaprenol N-acetyl-beta-D-mannosaminyltransferase
MERATTWHDITLTARSVDDSLELLEAAVADHRPLPTHLCNAYTLTLAERDERLADVLRRPGALNLVDGVSVRWVLQMAGNPEARTSRGPTLFHEGIRRMGKGVRQVFLGGTPATAEAMRRRLTAEGIIGDGSAVISPPFEEMTPRVLQDYVDTVRALQPDIVWVGLGTPKQDYVVEHVAHQLSVPAVAVGAAFDFYAGTVREAPEFLRDTGLEWTYRLATEPARLWRRYLVGNSVFLRSSVPVILTGRSQRGRAPVTAGLP